MKEIRNIGKPLEIRSAEDGTPSRHVEGYAIVFNSLSEDLGGFREIIQPSAVEGLVEASDVLCVLNHDQSRGVLARSRNGTGSLVLTVDEMGLKYSFEAPNTALGDEVLEGIRRGDISASSFAFQLGEDEWSEDVDGQFIRTIKSIRALFDVSPVYNPAYSATSVVCDMRGLEALKAEIEKRNQKECEEKAEEEEEIQTEEPKEEDENREGCQSEKEENREDEPTQEDEQREEPQEEEKENTDEEEQPKSEDKEDNKRYNVTMNKNKFSIVNAINSVINNRSLDDANLAVVTKGREQMQRSGITPEGTIVLPYNPTNEDEFRAAPNGLMATPDNNTVGSEAVATDLWNITEALRNRLVLAQAGAQILTLSSNVDIPVYDGSNVGWEGEIDEAKNGAGNFSKVSLAPKRLTGYVDISKQLLLQATDDVENLIRKDLINAIAEKFEATVLGDGAGSPTVPAGMFNGVVAESADLEFVDLVEMEAELEGKNIYGDYKYVVNPSAKAILRATKKDAGSGLFLMENGEILGQPTFSTNGVVKNGVIIGKWDEMFIGQFGALDLVVDPYTKATSGQIRIVVNMYINYVIRRADAFVKKILA